MILPFTTTTSPVVRVFSVAYSATFSSLSFWNPTLSGSVTGHGAAQSIVAHKSRQDMEKRL
jgi:hypothetical protein